MRTKTPSKLLPVETLQMSGIFACPQTRWEASARLYQCFCCGPEIFCDVVPDKGDIVVLATITPIFAAIGFSLIYLLLGGGLGGAILIFIIAKLLGK